MNTNQVIIFLYLCGMGSVVYMFKITNENIDKTREAKCSYNFTETKRAFK